MSDKKSSEYVPVKDVRGQTIDFEAMVAKAEKERGFTVPPINKEHLIDSIKWKDWSAYLIGEAFVSMYRSGISANLDLTGVCNLDAPGKAFLFQCIFARDVPGWKDNFYYEIEQEIMEILKLGYKDDLIRII